MGVAFCPAVFVLSNLLLLEVVAVLSKNSFEFDDRFLVFVLVFLDVVDRMAQNDLGRERVIQSGRARALVAGVAIMRSLQEHDGIILRVDAVQRAAMETQVSEADANTRANKMSMPLKQLHFFS